MDLLSVTIFKKNMKDSLRLDDNIIDKICDLLVETNAIIAGGSVLKSYTGYSNQEFLHNCNNKRDFDIYVNLENAEKLVSGTNGLIELGFEFSNVCSYIAPAYDDSFFKKNKILGRFILTPIVYHYYNAYLDILIVSNDRPLIDVVSSFDLSFCKIWFDGITVRAEDPEGVLNKTGTLGEDYIKSFLDGNYFTMQDE